MSNRSDRESTIRKRELSINTRSVDKTKEPPLFYQNVLNFCVEDGTTKRNKWDIVRNYFRERVAQRKINRMLNSWIRTLRSGLWYFLLYYFSTHYDKTNTYLSLNYCFWYCKEIKNWAISDQWYFKLHLLPHRLLLILF